MTVYQDKQLVIFQSALYQTNTTLFIANDFVLLVDPNWTASEINYIESYLHLHCRNKPIYLLFTHSDFDHIIGYKAFPNARVIASARFQNRPDKDRILGEIHQFDQQHYIKRAYSIEYPEVDIIVEQDGMQVEILGERLWFYDAPGHTDDGLLTIIESAGLFIAGDYLSDLEFPFIYYDSQAYLDTLDKVNQILQKHQIRMLVPGHGTYLKDKHSEILKRLERDRNYIEELKKCIHTGLEFPLDDWLSKFPFPDGLREQHSKNEEQIKKDLKDKKENPGGDSF